MSAKNPWLNEHINDEFVRRAHAEGYRSRAVYKLKELDEKEGLLRPGHVVLELGAAPGSWTQYVAEKVGPSGTVVASDILPMDPMPDVTFVKGDFTEQETFDSILQALGQSGADSSGGADLVLSDMAPNISGVAVSDQARSMALVELATETAIECLKPNGIFVVKVFQGAGFDEWMRDARTRFASIKRRKPTASRPRSREIYVVLSKLL